jgi:hypothetical protein
MMSEQEAEAALARALAALPQTPAPERIWQRLEHSLNARQRRQRAWRAWLKRWPVGLAPSAALALAACSAALFLWFGAINDPQADGANAAEPAATAAAAVPAIEQDIARLQQVSARLETQLFARRADSSRYDDQLAWTEAAMAAALSEVDQALANGPAPVQARSLWTRRVALLAGLNEQAQDPLPLGRVDWVQVD